MEKSKNTNQMIDLLNWDASAHKRRLLIAGVLIFFFTIMLILNILTPLISDDCRYLYSFADGTRIRPLADVFRSQFTHYYNMNGRVITQICVRLRRGLFE